MRSVLKIFKGKLIAVVSVLIMVAFFTNDNATTISYALDDWEAEWIDEANLALSDIVNDGAVMGSLYLCDYAEVKSAPSESASTVKRVYSGQLFNIISVTVDDERNVWEEVNFAFSSGEYTGYVLRKNIAISDERFLQWEMEYSMAPECWDYSMFSISMFSLDDGEGIDSQSEGEDTDISYYPDDILTFPESYRDKLMALKEAHPNWTFVKLYTGLDFDWVISEEMKNKKSYVYKTFAPCCLEAPTGEANWYYASEEVLSYYVDPRNFLTDSSIFQFEQLTYNETYHTEEAVEVFLAPTFMSGVMPYYNFETGRIEDMSLKFSTAIWALAKEVDPAKGVDRRISPFHMAARIIQEQGTKGGSPLISGTVPGYEGLYNYFNIGASGATSADVIINGLEFAKNNWKWSDYGSYDSLQYGADFLTKDYIKNGQDTLYLQKFNVNPAAVSPVITHQYMQNISSPSTESSSVKRMYENAGALDSTFVFKIPVFENMPDEPCPMPTSTTKATLYLPAEASQNGVSSTPKVWIDGVECDSVSRNGHIVVDTKVNNATTAVVYKYNSKGTWSGMYVWMLEYNNGAYTATYEPGLEDLLTYHGLSVRISGDSGIRYKTGIAASLKDTLKSTGVDGYKLSEYGTLVMKDSNRDTYPFIKDGEKVTSGISYGYDSGGQLVDKVFETVDGRNRFTAVFMNLPANRYKTDYAFRGYIILNNGKRNVTLYGYPTARSIYTLSQTLLSMNYYANGSAEDIFLKTIISDADAATE